MMRACLVSERIVSFREPPRERLRGLGLVLFRVCLRAAALDFDLTLVMGSSRFCDAIRRTTSAPHRQTAGQGLIPKRAWPPQVTSSNAPTAPERQSILSNVVARKTRISAVRIPLLRQQVYDTRKYYKLYFVNISAG
jgi:hypothetical protein